MKNPDIPLSLQWRNHHPYLCSFSSSISMYFIVFTFTLVSAKQISKMNATGVKGWTKPRTAKLKAKTQRVAVKALVITSYVWKTLEATGGAVWRDALERVWGLQVPQELESWEKVWCLSPRAFKGSSLHVWCGSHWMLCPSHCPRGAKCLVAEFGKEHEREKNIPSHGWIRELHQW